jgi:hypothetical protein
VAVVPGEGDAVAADRVDADRVDLGADLILEDERVESVMLGMADGLTLVRRISG